MTYKNACYDELQALERNQRITVSRAMIEDLAGEIVSNEVLQQYFWAAVLDFQGDLDAMGRGIYLYWDRGGNILDVAVVPVGRDGFPAMYPVDPAPVSKILEREKIPHRVAPYRYGGTDWAAWTQAAEMMTIIADHARSWAREMAFHDVSTTPP